MNIMGQLALIFGLSLVGEGVAALLPVSFPSSVISMVLLMALLLTGVIKDKHIKTVSNFLVANMAFFFIPSFVGIVEHGNFVTGGLGLAQPALRLGVLGAFFFSAVCRPSKRSFLGSPGAFLLPWKALPPFPLAAGRLSLLPCAP